MKKNTYINLIAFFISIYLIVRATYFFKHNQTNYAAIYLTLGILAIVIQIGVNYLKKNKEK